MIDIITSAIIAGALGSFGSETVKIAYNKLKSLMQRKFGSESEVAEAVEWLEQKPNSEGWKIFLKEALTKAGADKDAEIIKAAELLLAEVEKQPPQSANRQIIVQNRDLAAGQGSIAVGGNIFHSGGGKQNIAQGTGAIAKQANNSTEELVKWHILIENELSRLPIGKILFNPPEVMRSGILERIETRISRELHLNLRSKLKGSGIPQVEELKISELMKVRLSGEDFKIISLNEEEQIIEEKGFTEWAWDVTPVTSGKKVLHLHVTLRIKLPFGEERKDHPVLDKEIYVQINPIYSVKSFIVKHWQWIATTLILPLAAWVWTAYFK